MTLLEQLDADLRAAMRAKDAATVACIRQLKSRVQEASNDPKFVGQIDDAMVRGVIAAYVKSLQKASDEMASAGERSAPLRARYAAEVALLAKYMPPTLGEAETAGLVAAAIESLQISDAKQAGRVLGALIKEHREALDVALTRRLIAAALHP